MVEKAQINLRVDPEQKARWEAYIDESEQFVTLSSLIRTSVETHIQDDEPTEATQQSPALASDIEDLHEELTDVRQNVAWLREYFQEDVDIAGLAQDVFDSLEPLPDAPELTSVPEDVDMDYEAYQRHLQAKAVVDPDDPAATPRPQTAGAIADRVGTTPKRVHDAMEYLEDQFLPVVAIDYEGDRHYFTED